LRRRAQRLVALIAPGGIIAGTLAYRSELGETRTKLRLAQEAAAQKNCDAPKK